MDSKIHPFNLFQWGTSPWIMLHILCVMLRYVTLCYVTLRYVALCYVMLHTTRIFLRGGFGDNSSTHHIYVSKSFHSVTKNTEQVWQQKLCLTGKIVSCNTGAVGIRYGGNCPMSHIGKEPD